MKYIFPVFQKDAQLSWLTKGLAGIAKSVLVGEQTSALSAAAVRAGALSSSLVAVSLGSSSPQNWSG